MDQERPLADLIRDLAQRVGRTVDVAATDDTDPVWLALELAQELTGARERDLATAAVAHAQIDRDDATGARMTLTLIGTVTTRLDVLAHLATSAPQEADTALAEALATVDARDMASGRAEALAELGRALTQHGVPHAAVALANHFDHRSTQARAEALAAVEAIEGGRMAIGLAAASTIADPTERGWALGRAIRVLAAGGDLVAAEVWSRRLGDRRYRAWARSEIAHARVVSGVPGDLHLSAHATHGPVELNAMRHEMAALEAATRVALRTVR